MSERPLEIREASEADLPAIAEIYARVVLTSPATFDTEPPTLAEWKRRLASVDPQAGHHLLVATEGGAVAGYAQSGRFMERRAYSTTVVTSVYVAEAARGRGVGSALYRALIERLERSNARLAVAGITEANPASVALHRAFGFRPVGTFHGVGVKFDRPWDVTWYERPVTTSGPGT